jgi:hypothetical protein
MNEHRVQIDRFHYFHYRLAHVQAESPSSHLWTACRPTSSVSEVAETGYLHPWGCLHFIVYTHSAPYCQCFHSLVSIKDKYCRLRACRMCGDRKQKLLHIYCVLQLSQYSVWLRTGRPGFDPRQRQRIFLLASASRTALGPTQPPVQWVPGVKRGRGVMLTTHPNLVPRLRMSRNYTSSPPRRLHCVYLYLFYIFNAYACYHQFRAFFIFLSPV